MNTEKRQLEFQRSVIREEWQELKVSKQAEVKKTEEAPRKEYIKILRRQEIS